MNNRKRIFDTIFKGEKPVKGPIELKHRRIFILPTQHGLNFCVLLVVLLLIAFVYNNNLTYALSFMLISIFIVTILHSFKNLAGLIIKVGPQKPVFAGDIASINILLQNNNATSRFNLELKIDQPAYCDLPASSQQPLTLYAQTQYRGWFQYGTIRVTSLFPLGLFRAWSPVRFDHPVLVYPKPSTTLLPFPENASRANDQGLTKKGGSDDFYGLNEYQAGDTIKHIHWKAFAKGQGLLTKHFSNEQAAEIWLDYAIAPGYSTEERLSQLCRWIIDAESAGLSYGINLPNLRIPPSKGADHYAHCLKALALF